MGGVASFDRVELGTVDVGVEPGRDDGYGDRYLCDGSGLRVDRECGLCGCCVKVELVGAEREGKCGGRMEGVFVIARTPESRAK